MRAARILAAASPYAAIAGAIILAAMLLSTMVDGVVLVVNSSKTSKQHVKAAYARLEFARAKVFGVLLNQVDVNSQHYQYYRRYYGGYDTYGPYGSDSTDPYDPADNGPGKEV